VDNHGYTVIRELGKVDQFGLTGFGPPAAALLAP
jgi:hypothetical protein